MVSMGGAVIFVAFGNGGVALTELSAKAGRQGGREAEAQVGWFLVPGRGGGRRKVPGMRTLPLLFSFLSTTLIISFD